MTGAYPFTWIWLAGGIKEVGKSAHWVPPTHGARRAGAHCPQRGRHGHRSRHAPCAFRAEPALQCLHSWRTRWLKRQGSPQKVQLCFSAAWEDDITSITAIKLCQACAMERMLTPELSSSTLHISASLPRVTSVLC